MTQRGYLCLYCGRIRAESMFDVGNDQCHECIREGRSERIWDEANDGDGYVGRDSDE